MKKLSFVCFFKQFLQIENEIKFKKLQKQNKDYRFIFKSNKSDDVK